MRIILDLDETVADMLNPLISMHHDKYNSDIIIDDVTGWDLPHDMVEIFTKPGFFLHLPPIPGAIDGVAKLLEWGHDIIIATNHSNIDYIAADKVLWVQRNLPMLSTNMMIGARKDVLQGDIIIDDNPDYLINSPCPIKICMDRPWNKNIAELEWRTYTYEVGSGNLPVDITNHDFCRVSNWHQILRAIKHFAPNSGVL